MNSAYSYQNRPGSLGLSLLALAGLICLAIQLWEIIPGFVLLIFIPALTISMAQLALTPIYGVRMTEKEWQIEAGRDAQALPTDQIAYLRMEERGTPRTSVVLSDGTEVEMPQSALPDPITLIREATNRGIPVRHA